MRGSIGYISSLLIIFSGCSSKRFIALSDGGGSGSSITIRVGGEMAIIDRAGGYLTFHGGDRLLDRVKYMELDRLKGIFSDLYSSMPTKPKSYILYFKPNSSELTEESKSSLDSAMDYIRRSSPCIVDVVGHTDRVGDSSSNRDLSLKRAKYIESIIERSVDIDSDRVVAKGYGEEDLLIKTFRWCSRALEIGNGWKIFNKNSRMGL